MHGRTEGTPIGAARPRNRPAFWPLCVRIPYRVRAGDSLTSLAERYELSIGSIAR